MIPLEQSKYSLLISNNTIFAIAIFLIPWNNAIPIIANFGIFDLWVLISIAFSGSAAIQASNDWFKLQIVQFIFLGLIVSILIIPLQESGFISLTGIIQIAFIFLGGGIFLNLYWSDKSIDIIGKFALFYTLFIGFSFFVFFRFGIPLVEFDGNARYNPIVGGVTEILVISLAYAGAKYGGWKFIITMFFVLILIMIIGQRSLLLGITLVGLYYTLIKHTVFLITITIFSIFLGSALILYFGGQDLIEGSRLSSISTIFSDTTRIDIILDFFNDISKDYSRLIIGWGYEGWTSIIAEQEPHNYFLHLVSEYGLILALPLTIFVFRPWGAFINHSMEWKWFFILGSIGFFPKFMTHTFSDERSYAFPLLMFGYAYMKYRPRKVIQELKKCY